MVSNLNTMIWAAQEPMKNHLLVLELGGGIWIPGLPTSTQSSLQTCRHTWRLSMDGWVVAAESEDKVWSGYHLAWVTCTPPRVPALGTPVQIRSGGSSLQAARQEHGPG